MKLKVGQVIFNLLSMMSLFINVILFIPLFFYGAAKRNREMIFYAPLFFCVFSLMFEPPVEFDLYRHYDAYDYYCEYGEPLNFTKDFYLFLVTYLGCNIGFSHHFIYFISVFIYYSVIFSILYKLFSDPGWHVLKFLISLIILFTNNLVEISGIRFTTGLAFAYLYLLALSKEDKLVNQYLFLLLSVISHFSMMVLLPIHILFKKVKVVINIRLSIFLISLFALFGLFLVKPLVGGALVQFQSFTGFYIGAETYTTGEWGADRLEVQQYNRTGFIVESAKLYINVFITWLTVVVFSCSSRLKSDLYRLLVLCACINFVFIPFDTIYFRYQYFVILLSAILLYEQRRLLNAWIKYVLMGLLLSRLFIQYALGFLSSYKTFIVDIISGSNLFELGLFYQMIK